MFPKNQIHLPVAESFPVSLLWSLVYAYAIGYGDRFGNSFLLFMSSVFHLFLLISRETVDTLTPICLEIDESVIFACNPNLIAYLCSEVNCLYIATQK